MIALVEKGIKILDDLEVEERMTCKIGLIKEEGKNIFTIYEKASDAYYFMEWYDLPWVKEAEG